MVADSRWLNCRSPSPAAPPTFAPAAAPPSAVPPAAVPTAAAPTAAATTIDTTLVQLNGHLVPSLLDARHDKRRGVPHGIASRILFQHLVEELQGLRLAELRGGVQRAPIGQGSTVDVALRRQASRPMGEVVHPVVPPDGASTHASKTHYLPDWHARIADIRGCRVVDSRGCRADSRDAWSLYLSLS